MTEASTPPADADGYWHYTYVTYHPDTGEWYGGKHSTSNLNDGYAGSGHWVRRHPARVELVTEIIQFFEAEDKAYMAEAAMITTAIIDGDPLCRNALEGGCGIKRAGVMRLLADPEYREKQAAMLRARAGDPGYRRRHREAVIRLAADPEWKEKHRRAMQSLADHPTWKDNQTKAMAKLHADPEYQQNRRAGFKRWFADPVAQQKHREHLDRIRNEPGKIRRVREANVRRSTDPEWLRKMRVILVERNARLAADPEWQRKIREARSRQAADPEWRRKQREGMERWRQRSRDKSARGQLSLEFAG